MGKMLVVGGIKGGIGKSTVAANLAVLAARTGPDVLLIDADPQETTATWAAARADHPGELAPVTTVSIVGKQIREELNLTKSLLMIAGRNFRYLQTRALSLLNINSRMES